LSTSEPPTIGATLRAFLREFVFFAQGRIPVAIGLLFLAGCMEGLSLLLLIPLLGLTGFIHSAESRSSAAQAVGHVLDVLHIGFSLPTILLVFVVVVAAEAALSRWRTLYLSALEMEFTDHLRDRLYGAIGRAEWICHLRARSADAIQLLDETVSNISFGTYAILQLAVFAVQSSIYVLVALQSSFIMTLTMALTGLVLLLLVRPLNRRAYRKGQDAVSASQAIYRSMTEFIAGMKIVKSFGQEQEHVRAFNTCAEVYRNSQLAFQSSSTKAQMGFRIASACILSLFVYYAVTILKLPAEVLIVLIFLAHRLFGIFSSAQSYWQYILQMLPNFEHYQTALRQYQHFEELGLGDGPRSALQFTNTFRLNKISFSYPDAATQPTLCEIDFEIQARQTVAFIGPSGSGKSTLADIIMGLLVPSSGTIEVDGHILDRDSRRSWRQHVSYVPQDVYLFHESIRDNLLRAQPNADDRRLRAVLRQAAAETFVDRLPSGLDCVIGDRGVRLSGGERQRIALARALLRDPAILLLDEATSALDMENERQIHAAIERLHGSLTMIIIAHRLSTIQHADVIAIIENGKITESGTWEALLENQHGTLKRIIANSVI
jgi:ATP-binding cassette, subfamily C, bacterial